MKVLGIVPARYASSRFPGKPLADVLGKPMIQRVYEQARKAGRLERLIVATDDDRIFEVVENFGGEVVKTSPEHPSGTDRCNEVLQLLKKEGYHPDVIVNVQGDEPFIHPGQIDLLCACFDNTDVRIATLAKKISSTSELFNPSVNKVIVNRNRNAMYFSRNPIPYLKDTDKNDWPDKFPYLKHIGIYGFQAEVLEAITSLLISPLEKAESLEQLRWLENGYDIYVEETQMESAAIDTPEDLLKITNKP